MFNSAHYIIRNYLCYFTFFVLVYYEQYWIAIIYALGVLINAEINYILKNTIQEKRPEKEEFKNEPKIMYGMPSGHAQACFYSATFIWLIIENNYLHIFYFFCCVYTIILSLQNETHTQLQMAVGSIAGSSVAWALTNLPDTQSLSD